MFEELGFYYVGFVDGYNFEYLIFVLRNVWDMKEGFVFIYCVM